MAWKRKLVQVGPTVAIYLVDCSVISVVYEELPHCGDDTNSQLWDPAQWSSPFLKYNSVPENNNLNSKQEDDFYFTNTFSVFSGEIWSVACKWAIALCTMTDICFKSIRQQFCIFEDIHCYLTLWISIDACTMTWHLIRCASQWLVNKSKRYILPGTMLKSWNKSTRIPF